MNWISLFAVSYFALYFVKVCCILYRDYYMEGEEGKTPNPKEEKGGFERFLDITLFILFIVFITTMVYDRLFKNIVDSYNSENKLVSDVKTNVHQFSQSASNDLESANLIQQYQQYQRQQKTKPPRPPLPQLQTPINPEVLHNGQQQHQLPALITFNSVQETQQQPSFRQPSHVNLPPENVSACQNPNRN